MIFFFFLLFTNQNEITLQNRQCQLMSKVFIRPQNGREKPARSKKSSLGHQWGALQRGNSPVRILLSAVNLNIYRWRYEWILMSISKHRFADAAEFFFIPEEGEAGAPAHLGGHRRSRRRWGRAASRGGALTLVSCAKRGIPTTATCTLTPRNAEVHTARGRNTLGPTLGVKMREQNKKTFSAGSPQPSLRRLIARKTHAPWGVRGVCMCHLATRSQPIPCLLLSSAAWWPHRDTAWSVRPVSLYIEGKKNKRTNKNKTMSRAYWPLLR